MSYISALSGLSFFSVTKYSHTDGHICDFSNIPRPHYCMGFIIEGKGEFCFNSNSVAVSKGDIIFVPVGSTYKSFWSGNPNALYISVHFSFETNRIFTDNKTLEIQKINLDNFDEIYKLYLSIYSSYKNIKSERFAVLSDFYKLLDKIHPKLVYNDFSEIDSRILRAVAYIETHSYEKFEVDYLASLTNMSSSHFYACFKKSMGCGPIEYKNRICVHRAELMLIDGKTRTIEEISELAGFNSPIYFREQFKKITGKTPREYRKIQEHSV